MPVLRFIAFGLAKTLSKLFGLATMTLFGRLPSRDDDKIALVGVLSLTWLPVVVAVFVPAAAKVIVPFAPDDDMAARGIALTLAIVIPLVAGGVVARMHNNRNRGWKRALAYVVSGFVYVPIIGVVVAAIVVVVPLLKASHLVQRFAVNRIMVMAPAGSYERLVEHLADRLRSAGMEVEIERPHAMIVGLFRALGAILGRVFDRDVASDIKSLRGDADGDWFEVTVHGADITIVGKRPVACRVQAILIEAMDERIVYMTWDDASQALEDRIRVLRERLEGGEDVDPAEIDALVDDLAALSLGREEWDAVRRLIYRLEGDALRARARRPPARERAAQDRSVQARSATSLTPS